tara:strand:- start:377 stop:598 length:222 start_codon:yes stop_codon:yes gene_type:complete
MACAFCCSSQTVLGKDWLHLSHDPRFQFESTFAELAEENDSKSWSNDFAPNLPPIGDQVVLWASRKILGKTLG